MAVSPEDRARVQALLDAGKESEARAYVLQLKAGRPQSHQTAQGGEPKQRQSGLDMLLEAAGMTKDMLGKALTVANAAGEKTIYPVLDAIASGGRFANSGNQQLAQIMSDHGGLPGKAVGGTLSVASDYLLPQNRFGAAMMAFPAAQKGIAAGKSALGLTQAAAAGTKVVKPGAMANVGGAVLGASSATEPRLAAAVLADLDILTPKTPGTADVSKRYIEYFKSIGAKFDSDLIKKWADRDYLPDARETSRLETIVRDVTAAMKEGKTPSPEELFKARSAASAIQRTKANVRPNLVQWAKEKQSAFDDMLEKTGHGEIKELGRQWFRAVAKEAFEHILPVNKNMSPNALRSTLAGHLTAKAAEALAKGDGIAAATYAAQAATMTPKGVGLGIRAGRSLARPNAGPMVGSNIYRKATEEE